MTKTEDLAAQLQAAQLAEWEAEQAAEAEMRAKYPDAQRDYAPLSSPNRGFDPSPEAQQAFADQYRLDNPTAKPQAIADAIYAWRESTARAAWSAKFIGRDTRPACVCCGERTRRTQLLGGRERPLCSPCSAVTAQIQAERSASDLIGADTRRDLATQLLDRLT